MSRPFEMNEEVKLRARPGTTGIVLGIHQVNNIPVAVTLGGWGDRFFEEIAHLDEEIEVITAYDLDLAREAGYKAGYVDGENDARAGGA